MPDDLIQRITKILDWHQRGTEPEQGALGFTRMQRRGIDEDKRQVHFLCSTDTVDRYGEIVEPEAYRASLDAFMQNPVFAAGHQHVGLNGEPTVLGHWEKLWISKDGLEGIAQFDDEDELAQRYWNNYRKGHMRAVSVGFIVKPNGWDMREVEIDQERQRVRVFTDVDLLEISAVMVPANPDALVRRSAGDGGDTLDARVEAAVERKLKQIFHAGPGGLMTTLAQDIAELVVCGGQGMDDGDIHPPEEPDPGTDPGSDPVDDPDSEAEQDDELKALLQDALGTAG